MSSMQETTLTEAPQVLFTASRNLVTFSVHHGDSAEVWIKVWHTREDAPDPATDAPSLQWAAGGGVPIGHAPMGLVPGRSWWAATALPDTDDTAPAGVVRVTYTHEAAR